MFQPLAFLKDLTSHNDREWFQANRDYFESAKEQILGFTQELILLIGTFDESVRGIRPQDCLYRIYRDVRFSKDKSPYKNHFGLYISKGGKQGLHCGYYLHVTPGGSFLAGGSYGLTPKQMREVKLSILDARQEFLDIVRAPEFSTLYPSICQERLQRLPVYIPKDTPESELFLAKQYVVMKSLDDTFFEKKGAAKILSQYCKTMKPFLDFLNYTIDDL